MDRPRLSCVMVWECFEEHWDSQWRQPWYCIQSALTQCGTNLYSEKSRCKSACRDTLRWEPAHSCLVHTLCVAGPICNRIIQKKRHPRRSTVACYPAHRSKTVSVRAVFGWSHCHLVQYLKHIQHSNSLLQYTTVHSYFVTPCMLMTPSCGNFCYVYSP
jgi:hypothetical protein